MDIVVADDQLSLAIGKRGQNVRLAVQLTGWRLDIHSESQIKKIEKEARTMYKRLTKVPEGVREILIKTGYTTIKDLAEAEIEDLAAFPGIDEALAEEIIDEAYAVHITGEWPLPMPEGEEEEEILDLGQPEQALQAAHDLFAEKPGKGRAAKKAAEEAAEAEAAEAERVPEVVLLDEDDFEIHPEALPGIAGKTATFLAQRGFNTRNAILGASLEDLAKVPGMGMALAEDLKEAVSKMKKEDV
jgi:DNA uptake protein ComE-like DNA-binding protein